MTAEILVRLDADSDPLPLSELDWEHIAPCGCTSGLAVAEHYGTDHDAVVRQLIPNAEARKRDAEEGFTYRLAPRSETVDRIRAGCPHTPKWGVERVPIPAGHRWAHGSGRRVHLVPVPEDADEYRFVKYAAPLCGGKQEAFACDWNGRPTCRKCEQAARDLARA